MVSQSIFKSFLLLHLAGFVLFTGTFIADLLVLNQFWKQYSQDKSKAAAVLQAIIKFPMLMGIGFGVIILSGIGMMAMTHCVFGEQLWFRIKFGLVISIIIIRLTGRKQALNLRKTIDDNETGISDKLKKMKSNLKIFNRVQLAMFFIILLLSVFKFN